MKALVLNCTNNSGLVVMRALHRAGIEVIGADQRRLPFDLHSRSAKLYEQVAPYKSPEFIPTLVRILERHQPDVLLPGGAAPACSRARDELSRSTHLLVPEFDAFQAVHYKRQIVEQCRQSGIPAPDLLTIDSARRMLLRGDVEAVVVKPCENFGGGQGVSIVKCVDELERITREIANRHGEVLICEYVPGPDAGNIAIQVLFDCHSRLIGYFAQRKVRLQPPRIGVTAASVSVYRDDLLQSIVPMFTRLGWQGPADVEFKIDARTDEACLIEVNARFSGAIGFAIACGVDFPVLSCRAAMGEELPEVTTPNYREEIKYWNPVMYMRAIVSGVRNGEALADLPAKVYKELQGPRVGNPYRMSDPAPLLGKTLLQFSELFSRPVDS